jgi:bacterioferritin (cytochrome b1)
MDEVCEKYGDTVTKSLIEAWIDDTKRHAGFLDEASHLAKPLGCRARASNSAQYGNDCFEN